MEQTLEDTQTIPTSAEGVMNLKNREFETDKETACDVELNEDNDFP